MLAGDTVSPRRGGILNAAMTPRPLAPRLAPILGASALAFALAFGFAACSGGSDDPPQARSTTRPEATTTTASPIDVEATLGATRVVGAGVDPRQPPALDSTAASAVLGAVDRYVQRALVAPLRGDTADLEGLFADTTAPLVAVGSHDRSVLAAEGLPTVTTGAATLEPVELVGLTDGFATLPLVSARVAFVAELETVDGPLTITQLGELVLTPAGDHWVIVGYDVAIVRDDGTAATTTTATATTTAGAP